MQVTISRRLQVALRRQLQVPGGSDLRTEWQGQSVAAQRAENCNSWEDRGWCRRFGRTQAAGGGRRATPLGEAATVASFCSGMWRLRSPPSHHPPPVHCQLALEPQEPVVNTSNNHHFASPCGTCSKLKLGTASQRPSIITGWRLAFVVSISPYLYPLIIAALFSAASLSFSLVIAEIDGLLPPAGPECDSIELFICKHLSHSISARGSTTYPNNSAFAVLA
jgi:hypothetical protein